MRIYSCDVCGKNIQGEGDFYCPCDVEPHDKEINLELCQECWFDYDRERKRYLESVRKEIIVYLRDVLSKMRIGIKPDA